MSNRKWANVVAVGAPVCVLVMLLGGGGSASGQRILGPAPSDCGKKTVLVNLQAMIVGGVAVNRPIAEVRRDLGPLRNRHVTEQLEGQPSTAWDLEFCGHRARRHWNGLSWTDHAFRTIEGLGVGSQLSAFDSKYGPGEFFESESTGFRYQLQNGALFSIEVDDQCYKDSIAGLSVRGSRCVVSRVFIVLQPDYSP